MAGAFDDLAAGEAAGAAAAGAAPPRAFWIAAIAAFGSTRFMRCVSFCEAMTLPEILSLPVMNSFCGSALPFDMATKSSSESSSVTSAGAVPAVTEPAPFLRSTLHDVSGPLRWNWKMVPTLPTRSAFFSMVSRIATKTSALPSDAGSTAAAGAAAGVAAGAAPPRALMMASIAAFGSTRFMRCVSFCEAMTLPLIFSLPVMNSFCGSALPFTIARKSSLESSSVTSAGAVPAVTEPAPFLTSTLHDVSGPLRWNWKTVPTLPTRSAFFSMVSRIATKTSALAERRRVERRGGRGGLRFGGRRRGLGRGLRGGDLGVELDGARC